MPVKKFRADLAQAKGLGSFGRLGDVGRGDDDGSISFTYTLPSTAQVVGIEASVDTSEYPSNHTFVVYSTTDNIPEAVSNALERSQPLSTGLSIQQFLESISERIDVAIMGRPADDDEASPMGELDWGDDDDGPASVDDMDLEDEDDIDLVRVRDNPMAVEVNAV